MYKLLLLLIFSISCYAKEKPKLILQITVDQLRGDLPTRFMDKMGKDGFRYLYNNGVVFQNAHHNHANTETIVGHATLATGANPSVHGLVGNVWFDRAQERMVYNIEDANYHLLSANADVDKKNEIDPTQKAAKVDGRSPRNILCSTFSDELSISTNKKAKIFGVSVKDRGAISMAGHAGKAYWFSKAAGEFVTSSFYYDKYPAWVAEWNSNKPIEKYSGRKWDLSYDKSEYIYGKQDDQAWEMDFPGYGRVFPHNYGKLGSKYFTTLLTLSPAGDEVTLDFAKTLIANENLGQDAVTDYLSVSFSSTDYVGHVFGPSSLEAEDNLYRLDKTIAKLLKYIGEKVGLDNTLIVLSADHGGAEAPGLLNENGVEAHYVDLDKMLKGESLVRLQKEFGLSKPVIEAYFPPYIYLNRKELREKGVKLSDAESAVTKILQSVPGVFAAVGSTALEKGEFASTEVNNKILNNHNTGRSGDIYIVFNPHSFVNDFDGLHVTSHHSSLWSYDTHVPIVFVSKELKAKTVYRKVKTTALAPTLSAWLNIKIPSGSFAEPLVEVLEK
ncbi:MAG: alkaline phosphatase family protein [Lentisphaeraceae bacterium]|nr:alkaline phosphatase family protein [Lentisphaeraceae bacterium]